MNTRICTGPDSQPIASKDCSIEPKVLDQGYMHSHPAAKDWWRQSLVERLASARLGELNGEQHKSKDDRIYDIETALSLAARELQLATAKDVPTLINIARRIANDIGQLNLNMQRTDDYPHPQECSQCFSYLRRPGGPAHGPCRQHNRAHCTADSCF